eukprot:CFRG3445T1
MAMRKPYKLYTRVGDDGGALIENIGSGEAVLVENDTIATLHIEDKEQTRPNYTKRFDVIAIFGKLNTTHGSSLLCITNTHTEVKFSDGACIYRITGCEIAPISGSSIVRDADLLKQMRALIMDGSFYFGSEGYDITRSEQSKHEESLKSETIFPSSRCTWNASLLKDFMNAHIGPPLCPPCIRGYVSFRKIYTGMTENLAGIISRSGCGRAGTRFQTRGVDDDGFVANFAETEQLLEMNGAVVSYTQIRGSVPLFWEQPGINLGKHRVQIPRSMDAMLPAFTRHFDMLLPIYGPVRCLNLLEQVGEHDGEPLLSKEFEVHVNEMMRKQTVPQYHGQGQWSKDVSIVSFDFHKETRGNKYENLSKLMDMIHEGILLSSYFYRDGTGMPPRNTQVGVFRTNCLDCLDRTNAVMQLIGQEVLKIQLAVASIETRHLSRFQDAYKEMWYQNGDAISMAYAGTGAMKADFTLTGKRTKKGVYNDAKKSVKRLVQNNADDKRQAVIDVMLQSKGAMELKMAISANNPNLRVGRTIHEALLARSDEYTDVSGLRVCIGTWNTNNGRNFDGTNLIDWLVAPCNGDPPDVYAIGFQEIVNIEAKSIYKADEGNLEQWRLRITGALSTQSTTYNLLAQRQLVGVALLIFVAVPALPMVRDVVITKCNVGMHGLAGNKGGIGIRFVFRNTSFCFVCAHLAAGQYNVQDRIEDYKDITRSLDFGKGRRVLNHNYVFWLGDFNFRVDLPREVVIPGVMEGDYERLLQKDQLKAVQATGQAFVDFEEGEIKFAPTYKYNVNTDIYDTSEKQRTPAWTDRILWRISGESVLNCALQYYNRVDSIRTSDHRPVVAVVDVNVAIIDDHARKNVYKSLVRDGSTVIPSVNVSGLPLNVSPNDVRALFQPFGRVMALNLSNGSARVTFADEDSAVSCTSLSGSSFGSSTLDISLHVEREGSVIGDEDTDSAYKGRSNAHISAGRGRTDPDAMSLQSTNSYASMSSRFVPSESNQDRLGLHRNLEADEFDSGADDVLYGNSPVAPRRSQNSPVPFKPPSHPPARPGSQIASCSSDPEPIRPPVRPTTQPRSSLGTSGSHILDDMGIPYSSSTRVNAPSSRTPLQRDLAATKSQTRSTNRVLSSPQHPPHPDTYGSSSDSLTVRSPHTAHDEIYDRNTRCDPGNRPSAPRPSRPPPPVDVGESMDSPDSMSSSTARPAQRTEFANKPIRPRPPTVYVAESARIPSNKPPLSMIKPRRSTHQEKNYQHLNDEYCDDSTSEDGDISDSLSIEIVESFTDLSMNEGTSQDTIQPKKPSNIASPLRSQTHTNRSGPGSADRVCETSSETTSIPPLPSTLSPRMGRRGPPRKAPPALNSVSNGNRGMILVPPKPTKYVRRGPPPTAPPPTPTARSMSGGCQRQSMSHPPPIVSFHPQNAPYNKSPTLSANLPVVNGSISPRGPLPPKPPSGSAPGTKNPPLQRRTVSYTPDSGPMIPLPSSGPPLAPKSSTPTFNDSESDGRSDDTFGNEDDINDDDDDEDSESEEEESINNTKPVPGIHSKSNVPAVPNRPQR